MIFKNNLNLFMKSNLKFNEEKHGDSQPLIDVNPAKKGRKKRKTHKKNKNTEKICLFFIFLHSYYDYINIIVFYSIDKIL